MLEKIVNKTGKVLAGVVLAGSLAVGGASLGGCYNGPFPPKVGEFTSDNVLLPGVGVSAIATTAIYGGPIHTESVVKNGRWAGVRIEESHWNGHKFGEVYFEFPYGAEELGFRQMFNSVNITYKTDKVYNENWIIMRKLSFDLGVALRQKHFWENSIDKKGNPKGKWVKDKTAPPNVKAFYVIKNSGREEFVPYETMKSSRRRR